MPEWFIDAAITGVFIWLALKFGHFAALVHARFILGQASLAMADIKATEADEPDEIKRQVLDSHALMASQTSFMNMLLMEEIVANRHPILYRTVAKQWNAYKEEE